MNTILEDIGSKVRKLREFRDISQDYMAEQLGISQSHYSRIEKGERTLDSEQLEKIAKLLETTVEGIKAFETNGKYPIFNTNTGTSIIGGGNNNVHCYQIDPKLDKLYQDHIALLKESITSKNKVIENLKKENENLKLKMNEK